MMNRSTILETLRQQGDFLEQLLGQKVDVLTPAGIENIRMTRVARNIRESMVYV